MVKDPYGRCLAWHLDRPHKDVRLHRSRFRDSNFGKSGSLGLCSRGKVRQNCARLSRFRVFHGCPIPGSLKSKTKIEDRSPGGFSFYLFSQLVSRPRKKPTTPNYKCVPCQMLQSGSCLMVLQAFATSQHNKKMPIGRPSIPCHIQHGGPIEPQRARPLQGSDFIVTETHRLAFG